jgi:hypothetical protein
VNPVFEKIVLVTLLVVIQGSCWCSDGLAQDVESSNEKIIAKPDLFAPLTEPPCSYCVNQNLKRIIKDNDVVLAWIRGQHNGGAMPLRHFIAAPRVVNDTYGLFFFDADGGYVASYKKDYGYRFYGWRGGVMVVKGKDGTLWSALSGRAIEGPQAGAKLERVPSMLTTWKHWLMLHPESTAYDLFDGKKYPVAELPTDISPDALASIGDVDQRLEKFSMVLGIEGNHETTALTLENLGDRNCRMTSVDGKSIAVFWYGPTKTAVAFVAEVDDQPLTFYADDISPETAPFKDRETGTRWTLAGRAVDGKLRGRELEWAPSIACRWYAWSHEYPKTKIDTQDPKAGNAK